MRALVVANPAATTTNRDVRDDVLTALSGELKVDLAETTHRGHGTALARQSRDDGVDVVIALGGDGTVNEVVNGLLRQGPGEDVPLLAVVPGGSTNVFSRALGRSRDPVRAAREIADSLRAGRTRRISLGTASARGATRAPAVLPDPALAQQAADAGAAAHPEWTEPRWFAFSAGLGFDADVIGRVEAQRARGRRSTGALYVVQATSAFVLGRERREPAMTLDLPGEPPLDGLFLCLVSNVSPWTYLGARPVNPSPEASFDAGLDVFAMGRVGVFRMLHHVRQVFAAEPDARGRGVHRRHDLAGLTITAQRPQGWQVDGDHLGTATGLRLCSVAAALRVVA
ncbi:diacylglycerol/lipid kinase family protein [Geodermatophilus sabuli]|uniref:Diacylglycerol kinase family enzyme n=1 Tax=Geodermatophilus sabuli TaxID=1564158 RepID=A0A285EH59_9ACTN|nr:diacylglycerol kinase family protein [Geodermatophilus sabuli]MBB3085987.1 diacylglycerol kinase family enzyme [Geodermatophilus sabuli]SNX98327.1 Diacylglycerol kinase family enzyme [Geodermatophilus sabuli]